MTKLIKPLIFSSSKYDIHDINIDQKCVSESVPAAARESLSKRSAVSASDAECFSLCLGAGPLCCAEAILCPVWSEQKQGIVYQHPAGGPDVPAADGAPPGGAASGASSPATPATPTHDDNYDLLSGLLAGGKCGLSRSAETLLSDASRAASRSLSGGEREAVIAKILERKEKHPVKIDFKICLTENTASQWEAVVQGSVLYLRLPGVLSSGSKESFMVLLDFAEERLGCKSCILCVRKNRPDRALLLRTFMFMGFALLPPGSAHLPRGASVDYVYLHHNMQ